MGNGTASVILFRINGSVTENAGQISSPKALDTGRWYHIVAQYNGTDMELYQNGVRVKSDPQAGLINSNANSIYIGCYYSTSYCFKGVIDEVAFFNVTLTPTQIADIYQSGQPKWDYSDYKNYTSGVFFNMSTSMTNISVDLRLFSGPNATTPFYTPILNGTLLVNEYLDPSVTSVIWATTGGVASSNLTYTQIISYFNATCAATTLSQCNITIVSPTGVVAVNPVNMTNVSSSFTYDDTQIVLNETGIWVVNITAYGSYGAYTSTTNLNVTTVYQSLSTEYYGYDSWGIPSNTSIANLAGYKYNLIELKDYSSTMFNNWEAMKDAIHKANDLNMKVGLKYSLNYNLSNAGNITLFRANVTYLFPDLILSPYLDTLAYIVFEVNDTTAYNDSVLTVQNLNKIGNDVYDATGNLFTVYTNYSSANLSTLFIRYPSDFQYITDTTEAGVINQLANLSRSVTTRSRIYYNITDDLKTVGMNYFDKINIPQTADSNVSSKIAYKLATEI